MLRSGSFAAGAARPGQRHVTHVDGETQIGRQTFRGAVEQVRRDRGDLPAGLADDVQVRVLGGVVDRRPLAQVGVPDQAEPLEQLEVAVDRRGVRRGAARARPPRAAGRRSPRGWRAPAPSTAASTCVRWAVSRRPRARSRSASGARVLRARYPCDEPRPAVGQAGPVIDQRRVAIWRDGAAVAVPADEPVVTAFDQGLGRGDGVFESVAVRRRRHPAPGRRTWPGCAARRRCSSCADPGAAVWRALVDAVLADWPADVEGVCRLFLTRGLGEGLPPTALALLSPVPAEVVRQRAEGISVVSLGLGVPADFRARAPWLLGGAKTLSYAVNMAALAARARASAPTTSSSPRWRASCSRARRRRSSGPPAARCTPRRWRPGSCPAPRWPGCSTGPRTTAGRPRAHPGTVADLHAADAVWLLSGIRGAAACTRWTASARGDAGLTARVRELLAR